MAKAKVIVNDNGTPNADTLKYTEATDGFWQGFEGNDTITIAGDGISVDGGAGKDKITIDWKLYKNATIKIDGEEVDTITFKNAKLANFIVELVGGDLILTDRNNMEDKLTLSGWNNWPEDFRETTKALVFADGARTWDFVNKLAAGELWGSNAADKLTVNGDGAGVYAEVNYINAGLGKDTVTVSNVDKMNIDLVGGANTVKATKVDDVIINGGVGTDTVNINGATEFHYTSHEAQTGVSKITAVDTQNINVETGAGKDTITLKNVNGGFVNTGAGNDTINVSAGSMVVDVNAGDGNNIVNVTDSIGITVDGGENVDTIKITRSDDAKVHAGAGDDKITVVSGNNAEIEGGAGNDKISIDWKLAKDATVVIDNDGVDTITVKNAKLAAFDISYDEGFDKLYLTDSEGNTLTFENWKQWSTAAGARDTAKSFVFADGSKTWEYIDGLARGVLYGTTGKDKLNVNADSFSYVHEINAKAGNDTVNVTGINGVKVNLESGTNTVTIKDANDIEVVGGSGVDTINVSGTLDLMGSDITIDGGAGADKINVYMGFNDNVTIKGDAADIITFKNTKVTDIVLQYHEAEGTMTIMDKDGHALHITNWEDVVNGTTKKNFVFADGAKTGAFLDGLAQSYIAGSTAADTITITGGDNPTAAVGKTVYKLNSNNDMIYVDADGGNDTINVNNVDAIVVEGGDGADKITVENTERAYLSGDLGNDTYNVDWKSVGYTFIKNDNDGGVGGSVKQEADVLNLQGASVKDITFSKAKTTPEIDDNTQEYDVVRITDNNNPEHYVDITNWDDNKLSKVVLSDKTLTAADIDKILAGGDDPEPDPDPSKTEIMNVAKNYGEHFFKEADYGTYDGYTQIMQKGTATFIAPVAIMEEGSANNNTVTVEAGAKLNIGSDPNDHHGHARAAYVANGTASNNVANLKGGVVGGEFIAVEMESGEATDNTVNIESGSADVVGGALGVEVNTIGNIVNIKGGTVERYVFGGEAISGKVEDNTVAMSGGFVGGNVYGGAGIKPWVPEDEDVEPAADINNNHVVITGGKVGGNVLGGRATAGTANENSVVVEGAVLQGNVYGGFSEKGDVKNNTVELTDANIINNEIFQEDGGYNDDGGYIYGGRAKGDYSADGNSVVMNSGSVITLRGGRSDIGSASNNTVTINGGLQKNNSAIREDNGKIYSTGAVDGGRVKNGIANSNTITINAGTVEGVIRGVRLEEGGTATGNKVNIKAGNIQGDVYGAFANQKGTLSENKVDIQGGDISSKNVYGARVGQGNANKNTVIIGEKANAEIGNAVFGGYSENGNVNGNTVEVTNANVAGGIGISELLKLGNYWEHGILGGYNRMAGTADNNTVKVTNTGTENIGTTNIAGGIGHTGANGNTVVVEGPVVVAGGVSGGRAWNEGNANNNSVTLDGIIMNQNTTYYENDTLTDDGGYIYGGRAVGTGDATGNSVNFVSGTTIALRGARTDSGHADNNTVTIHNGNFIMVDHGDDYKAGFVEAARTESGTADNNTLTIEGGSFEAVVRGARVNTTGSASGNEVNISGGTFAGNVVGAQASKGGNVSNNIVTLTSGVVDHDVIGGNSVSGTAENNKVVLGGDALVKGDVYDNKTKDGVTGDGSITVGGSANVYGTLFGGAGVDTITVNSGTVNNIDGGEGDDIIVVNGGSVHTIFGGAGNDSISVDWSKVNGNLVIDQVDSENDTDSLTINGAQASDFSFDVQEGMLYMTDGAGKTLTINGWGTGMDQMTIGGKVITEADMNAGGGAGPVDPVDPATSLTIDFASAAEQTVTVTKAQLGEDITTLALADSSIYLNDCYAQVLPDGELELRFADDNDVIVGTLIIEDAGNTQIEKIVAGDKTLNLVHANETKTFVGTDATEGYVFVDKGWNVTIEGGMVGNDALHLGAMRDKGDRVTRYTPVREGNDLVMEVFFEPDEKVVVGNITLKDYFADADGNGIYDGNETKNRILTAYMPRSSSSYTTTWDRMYVDKNDEGVDLDVKQYMGTVGERTENQPNKSARGIFLSTGAGNDNIVAGNGRDYIMTGAGDDTVYVHNQHYVGKNENNEDVFDDTYVADQSSQNGRNQIFTGAGNDRVYVGDFDVVADTSVKNNNNFVRTSAGEDYINIRGDFNDVNAGGDNDTVWVRGGNNRVRGGAGDDTIVMWSGGTNTDQPDSTSGGNLIYGNDGNDTLLIRAGNHQTVGGGTGDDTIFVQWNRANNLTIDNKDAAATDSDTLVLAGISEANMAGLAFSYDEEYDSLSIEGVGEYGETTRDIFLNIDGFSKSSMDIKLLDVDTKKTYSIASDTLKSALEQLGGAELSFAGAGATSVEGIATLDQEHLDTLKITANNVEYVKK